MHSRHSLGWPVLAVAAALLLAHSAATYAADQRQEPELLALLKSDAPPADKALACKRLAVVGSDQCVPELAKLLSHEQLASWARIPLEVLPGAAADEALRTAASSLQGRLLIGVVNSIGVRRDAAAVPTLVPLAKHSDHEVASSAAVALGQIGDAAATTALRDSLADSPPAVRSAVAEGLILCAEKAVRDGRNADAIALYDQVRKADLPSTRIVEATRGAILSRQEEGIPLLLETLASPDKRLFQIGLSTARELTGPKTDAALVEILPTATPERAALVVAALADRRSTASVGALTAAAAKGPQPVRVAALEALGRIGDASCFATLLSGAQDADPAISAAGKQALVAIADAKVNQAILDRLSPNDEAFALLVELAGLRRLSADKPLFAAAAHKDAKIRIVALGALGNTIPQSELGKLIAIAVNVKDVDESAAAWTALLTASVRMPDRESCAGELAAALERTPPATKVKLLPILGAVGGTKALAAVGAAAKSTDDSLQDASSRVLGEWSTIDAAPVLLDLSKSAPGDKYRTRALRGYIRIARQFVMPEAQRVEMCEKALAAADQTAEKKLVLEVLKRYPSVGTLRLAAQAADTPALKSDATAALAVIAGKIGAKDPQVAQLVAKAGMAKIKLEIIKAEYGAGSQVKDVTALIRKHAADSPLVTLPAATYNEAFGGDPAPGVVKQLKIQYRANGKAADAAFAENALILLP